MSDTVKQTTPDQDSQLDPIQWKYYIEGWIKETWVGNGFFKSERLFNPEQPNLEDEISLRGEGL